MLMNRTSGIRVQVLYIALTCVWYVSPFYQSLPTILKASPIFIGLIIGACLLGSPTVLIQKNVFSIFVVLGVVYGVVVALLIKSDHALFMQINMLFVGFYAYYIACPYKMQPYAVLWIIIFMALPLSVANNLVQGHPFSNVLGALSGTRSTFTIPGGTHHIMGLLGALAVLGALATLKEPGLPRQKRAKMASFCTLLGCALLITSGARSYLLAIVVTVPIAHIFRGQLRRRAWLAYALPLAAVPLLYYGGSIASREADIGQLLKLSKDPAEAEATAGRYDLWLFHISLWEESPVFGNTLEDLYSDENALDHDGRSVQVRSDGSAALATTESFYDYFLARDGLTSVVTFAFFYCLYCISIRRGDIVFFSYMVFWFVASFGTALLRITYSIDNFLMALFLIQCYRQLPRR
jgi:hypothetical protein